VGIIKISRGRWAGTGAGRGDGEMEIVEWE